MCDCIEKKKKEWAENGLYEVDFKNARGKSIVLPFSYRVKNDKNDELTKKIRNGAYIPKYCPFCGEKLREDE